MAEWQSLETAPPTDPYYDAPRVLVYVKDAGIQMGHVYVYPDGRRSAQAEGFTGNWEITHWMPLPEPPKP